MKQQILELIDRKMEKIPSKYNPINIILQELRSEIEKMEEWIPIDEQYPEDHTYVLVSDSHNIHICLGCANEEGRWIWFGGTKKWTHWKPLPLPPNKPSHD